jgi:hypothetical protein
MTQSGVEQKATPFQLGRHSQQDRRPENPDGVARPGEADATQPGGPVNWRGMPDDDYDDTFGALCDFLAWAVPHWAFTTEQFPYNCWWQHSDITEEMTAWWGLWQAYIRNPAANIADPIAFHERTHTLKQRLADTYRGRCRHGHQPPADTPPVILPSHVLLS